MARVESELRTTAITVAGREVGDGDARAVRSPWDGETVGAVPTVGAEEARRAVEAAADAMREPLPAYERGLVLERAAGLVRERREEIAHTLAHEIGKPLKQALVEVDRCVQTLTFSAIEARTLAGEGIAVDAHPAGAGKRGWTLRVPIGVVGAITPFNFPLNLAAHKIGPAIAAGCGAVVKPAGVAPLACIKLVRILHEAGLPPELLSVVTGSAGEIGDVFVEDERVRMITFTGSAEVGWDLAARAAKKKVSLELGNTTPLLVCADADLDAAATAAAVSGNGFAGQSCISVQRILVDRAVHDDFVASLEAAVGKLKLGDPEEADTDVGPLIDEDARARVSEWIDEAVDAGAERVAGGTGEHGHLRPTVLDGVATDVRVWTHEVFGPVVGVRTFSTLEEGIELANGTPYGLQAGIFTRDLATAITASERLEFGGVTINEAPTFRVDQMPYGGTKESGNTREGPHYTVREMTEERMVVLQLP
ncbi:MAG: aldehyde dehydrogenase family protein [Thermoleophilia bacterium]|nr:aldehyde dehydrogenase family protein [Thermoleophilia bacterium]